MSEQTEGAEVEAALLSVTWPDGGRDGMPTRKIAGMLAPAVLPLIAAAEARGAERALREAADDLGAGPTMRVLVERESCDWWTDRPVAAWLRARAAQVAPSRVPGEES